MEKQEEKEQMRIFIHGTDKGNVTLTAIVLVMVLSSVFIAAVARIIATERFAVKYKAEVVDAIEQSNREIVSKYDLR